MNRKLNLSNSVFYLNSVQCQNFTTNVRSAVFQPRHRPTVVLLLVYCLVDNTLFEASSEIRCSGVSIATVVMETTQLVLSQFKNLLSYQLTIGWRFSLVAMALVSINVVTLCLPRLVAGWVTVFGRVNYLGM